VALSERERAIRERLKSDLEHYAARCLKIRTKAGKIEPLLFNRMQRYLHARIEEHAKRNRGRVRVLILKARQQGCSTYIGARFYHRATHTRGQQVFILTHEQPATDNLFDMANRFHEYCPQLVKPHTGAANAKELNFDRLDSGYTVGTAGTRATGRSRTLQLFHGSELAFWPNAADHFSGVLQAVPDLPGTEVVLESTGHGIGGEFHDRWQQAEARVGDFEAIFVPWFWSDEYRRATPAGFVSDDEEIECMEQHGLALDQIVWRRAKIHELKDPALFKQEYPATAAEAFEFSGHDSFIKPDEVMRARKAKLDGIGPLVVGADPARFGDDRFSLAWRRGRKVFKIESRQKVGTVDGANWIKHVIDTDNPARVFIDLGGVGAGTFDILQSWGAPYDQIVVGINFGGEPQEPVRYLPGGGKEPGPRNRRAEMWERSKEWLGAVGGADIPDSDELHADACGPGYSYDMQQRLVLESKDHMRARGIRSPDTWDAIALTFSEPVKDIPKRTGNRKRLYRFEYNPYAIREDEILRGASGPAWGDRATAEWSRARALGLPFADDDDRNDGVWRPSRR
jgi:hypothetical protein